MTRAIATWSEVEVEAWQRPLDIPVSQWADENRILDEISSAEPGQWRTSRTPYLRMIMDCFTNPRIEKITIMSSTQIGKTEALYNMIGYAVDQDPAPALLVMPKDPDVRQIAELRLKPMINKSDTLKSHLTGKFDDLTLERFRFDKMILYFGSSNSPSDLAGRPVRYLFLDETDKYPPFSGKEADPIKLATERTATFWDRKIFNCSTPTTKDGYIYCEYQKTNKLRYFVPCPHCGKYQVLVFAQIKKLPEEHDPERIKAFNLAWYECIYCGEKIIDRMKPAMLNRGVWAPENAEIDLLGNVKSGIPASSHYGFWINALYSPWRTFSEVMAEFLSSKDKIKELMNFVNSWLAEIWEERTEELLPEKLIKCCLDYQMGTVPPGTLVLTAGVDVQLDHFYVLIRGWGYGEESWLIRTARLETWKELETVLFNTTYPYEQEGIEPLAVRLACVDSGYRTDEVYAFCRKWREVARPTKGHDFLSGLPCKASYIDRHPGTGAAIKNGLILWHLDVSHFKDKITRLVHTAPGNPGEWHLYAGIDEIYLNQFCGEQKVMERDRKTGRTWWVWKKKASGGRVDFWDCEVYAVAAAEMLRIAFMRPDAGKQQYQPEEKSNFIGSTKNWIKKTNGSWVRR